MEYKGSEFVREEHEFTNRIGDQVLEKQSDFSISVGEENFSWDQVRSRAVELWQRSYQFAQKKPWAIGVVVGAVAWWSLARRPSVPESDF